MKYKRWQEIAELIGIGAIVVSLIFVGLQMQQAQKIAAAESSSSFLSYQTDFFALINEQADIWVNGNKGEELNDVDAAIYVNLVTAANDLQYYGNDISRLIYPDSVQDVDTPMADFSLFLFENPGARIAWTAREDKLHKYRDLLVPGGDRYHDWAEGISAMLAKLDQTNK